MTGDPPLLDLREPRCTHEGNSVPPQHRRTVGILSLHFKGGRGVREGAHKGDPARSRV